MNRDEIVTWFYKQALCYYSPQHACLIAEWAADWLDGKAIDPRALPIIKKFNYCPI